MRRAAANGGAGLATALVLACLTAPTALKRHPSLHGTRSPTRPALEKATRLRGGDGDSAFALEAGPDRDESCGPGEMHGDGWADTALQPGENAWRPKLPSDIAVSIDWAHRRIDVVDAFGSPVNPRTGRPRLRPAVPVLEIEVPDGVAAGQAFTYAIAGHGNVRLKAPPRKRGLETGLGTLRRHTILTAAPPREAACVPSGRLRGCDAAVLANGTEISLGFEEDLDGGPMGGHGNGSLPAELLYVPPFCRYIAPPAAAAAAAAAAAPTAATKAPTDMARGRADEAAEGVVAVEDEWAHELPTSREGTWEMPRVNCSEYAAVLEAALQADSTSAWEVLASECTFVYTRFARFVRQLAMPDLLMCAYTPAYTRLTKLRGCMHG